jgi:hypothetical protein
MRGVGNGEGGGAGDQQDGRGRVGGNGEGAFRGERSVG